MKGMWIWVENPFSPPPKWEKKQYFRELFPFYPDNTYLIPESIRGDVCSYLEGELFTVQSLKQRPRGIEKKPRAVLLWPSMLRSHLRSDKIITLVLVHQLCWKVSPIWAPSVLVFAPE